jgi:CRP/FNR family nitrogen fixation transcriptional regulator
MAMPHCGKYLRNEQKIAPIPLMEASMLITQNAAAFSRGKRTSTRAAAVEKSMRRGAAMRVQERSDHVTLSVAAGCIRICHPLLDGKRQITDFLFAGDRISLTEVRGHNGSIEAVTSARVLLLPNDGLDGDDGMPADLYRARLGAMQARLFMLGHKNAREKLAAFLLEMSERVGQGGDSFHLPMSRYDIADYLCLSPETVCRNFTLMVSDGLLSLPDSQTVQILHRAPLEFIGR